MGIRILIIDDEEAIVRNLKDYFEDYDFGVVTAFNGKEGLARLKEKIPDIVIVDLNMPVMDGYEFTKQAKASHPSLPIIVLSGVGLVDEAMKAVRLGAWDFISKPVSDMQIVLHTVEKCLEKARLIHENEKYHHHLEELVVERTHQLEKTKRRIINCLGKAAEFKDHETGHHVVRVSYMSHLLAQGMGLDEAFCLMIRDAAPMHDVGKIGIMDRVLLKNGKLNDEEWSHMKQHAHFGCRILTAEEEGSDETICSPRTLLNEHSGLDILTVAKRIALFHHERMDGTGYPFGLSGEQIPIEARIVSLVDVYDALSSERPYKKPFPGDQCVDIIRKGAGTQFDSGVVDVFLKNLAAITRIRQQFID